MKFTKYHGLGNDYIVLNPAEVGRELTEKEIQRICDRHYGVGSDGILWGPIPVDKDEVNCALRIFNPDGSEAEKSGNGLRIFSRYLWDQKIVTTTSFKIQTLGGIVDVEINSNSKLITVDMGQVSFRSKDIPVRGQDREVLNETIVIEQKPYTFCAVTIGNPHCVVLGEQATETLAKHLGPQIETHSLFPKRTNVQFLEVLDRHNIKIEIWERGAGYTLASGSSSCAAAAVSKKLGYCESPITVHMPGGTLQIQIDDLYHVRMSGPVTRVCDGTIDLEVFTV
ncbi:MAG: diaminopimelate epimerase [Bacteroidetes bacterium]|nr:diaminopimelate epimerase [Bacteroidota bacterium]